MTLAPHVDRTAAIRSSAAEFLQAFRQRVAAGLQMAATHGFKLTESGSRRAAVAGMVSSQELTPRGAMRGRRT